MIDDVVIEEDGDEERNKESINTIVLRCYPTPSQDVKVDVNDDDDVKEKDYKDQSINIIVLRCYPTPSYDVKVDVNDDDDVKDEDKGGVQKIKMEI